MRRKEISFKGQTIYVGIDVHKTTWVVTVMTEVGNYEKKFSVSIQPLFGGLKYTEYLCAVLIYIGYGNK